MLAWQLNESSVLQQVQMPEPIAGDGEILVRVHAAGVTPTELLWYPTTHTKTGDTRLHAVPGHEFSGTIAAIGSGVDGYSIGQKVFGMNDWFADGATAEYCITRPEWIAARPSKLTHEQAASVPIGALTAWQGLFDRAHLQPGERVLIHGGSGAVGVFAIQLARRQGAHVITTASARNESFLLRLGAEQVIDYRTGRFEQMLRDIDVVFDGVGGETLKRSWNVLGPTGRLVTIAADSEGTADERTKAAFFIVEPKADQLAMLGKLFEKGELQTVVDTVVPFERAGAAYTGDVANRLGRGKVVVTVG